MFFNNPPQVSSFDIGMDSGSGEVLPEMRVARALHTSTVFGKYIYVFGGRDELGALNSCER